MVVLGFDGLTGDGQPPAVLDFAEADETTAGVYLCRAPTNANILQGGGKVEDGSLCIDV